MYHPRPIRDAQDPVVEHEHVVAAPPLKTCVQSLSPAFSSLFPLSCRGFVKHIIAAYVLITGNFVRSFVDVRYSQRYTLSQVYVVYGVNHTR